MKSPLKEKEGRGGDVLWLLVPQIDQQVVCYQLGAACLEFGTRRKDG